MPDFAQALEQATSVSPGASAGQIPVRLVEDATQAVLQRAEPIIPAALKTAADHQAVTVPPLTREGVTLAKLVLGCLAISTILILALTVWEDVRGPAARLAPISVGVGALASLPFPVGDETKLVALQKFIESAKNLLDAVAAQQRDTREFIIKIAELILLNLFLPVLTAILGYIFGTRQAGGSADRGS
jgi:hypothetical protein